MSDFPSPLKKIYYIPREITKIFSLWALLTHCPHQIMIIVNPLWVNYLYFAPVLTMHSDILIRSRKRKTTINTHAGEEKEWGTCENQQWNPTGSLWKVFLNQRSGRVLEEALSISLVHGPLQPPLRPAWEVLPFLLFSLSTFQVPIEGCIPLNIVPVRGTLWDQVVLSLKYFKAHIAGIVVFCSYNPLKYL